MLGAVSQVAPSTLPLRLGRYLLQPVRSIRCDSLTSLLGVEPVVYICNCPEASWYSHFGWAQTSNTSVNKKRRMFAALPAGSQWVSMTNDHQVWGSTYTWRSPTGILHLGRGSLRGRAAQLWQVVQLMAWLLQNRQSYATCYVYNFDQPQFLAGLAAKVLLRKRLVVDYEDDYTTYRASRFKNALEAWLRRTVDGAVCVNAHMQRYFANKPTAVVNAFADLSYMPAAPPLREGMTFVYSGRLDALRGADLLPEVILALRARLKSFRVQVTGRGPLQAQVEACALPELQYLGFLPDADLAAVLRTADACLILQRPDEPFSRGSYPSKIETYAEHRKPIFALNLSD